MTATDDSEPRRWTFPSPSADIGCGGEGLEVPAIIRNFRPLHSEDSASDSEPIRLAPLSPSADVGCGGEGLEVPAIIRSYRPPRSKDAALDRARREVRLDIAKNCLGVGIPVDQIVLVTGLTHEELSKLQLEDEDCAHC